MRYGGYTFTPTVVNNLSAVEVIADSGCVLGSWYMGKCTTLETFIDRFFDPFAMMTSTRDA